MGHFSATTRILVERQDVSLPPNADHWMRLGIDPRNSRQTQPFRGLVTDHFQSDLPGLDAYIHWSCNVTQGTFCRFGHVSRDIHLRVCARETNAEIARATLSPMIASGDARYICREDSTLER